MSLLLSCPVGSEVSDVYNPACSFKVGQIQKLIITRRYSSGTTRNGFTALDGTPSPGDPLLEATWTTLFSASDSTKVVTTPKVSDPTSEGGEQITFGSGNQVIDGIELDMGNEPTVVTAKIYNPESRSILDLRALRNELLAAYMIDEHDTIIGEHEDGLAGGGTITEFYPVFIYQFQVGARVFGGKDEPDYVPISFKMKSGWDEKLTRISPTAYSPLAKDA